MSTKLSGICIDELTINVDYRQEFKIMKNLIKLNDKGVIGAFQLEGRKVLVAFVFASGEGFYCLKTGTKLVIPSKFKSNDENISDLFDYANSVYNFGNKKLTEVRDLEEDEKTITERITTPRGFVPLMTSEAKTFLEAEGFDCSALDVTLSGPSFKRDYSDLLRNPEAQEQFERIKSIVKKRGAELPDTLLPIAEVIKTVEDKRLFFLVGPAGTGKTMLTYLLSQYCGAPLFTYQGSEGVEKDQLVYRDGLNTEAREGDSQYIGIHGPLLRAYVEGWHIVIDEANYLMPGVMSCLNSMMDDTPTYTPDNGKVYVRHPNFVCYLTSNQGYEGTYLYNPALKSRGYTIEVNPLTEDEFAARLDKYTESKLKPAFFKELNKLGNFVQTISIQYGESSAVCLRHAQNFCNLILAQPCTAEQFAASFRMSYLSNTLCMDANNTVKIEDLVKSPEFKSKIESLYALYDYAVTPEVKPSANFADFLGDDIETLRFDDKDKSRIESKEFEDEFNDMFAGSITK